MPVFAMNTQKNVLITGCSTGIGRALAIAMGNAGCRVYASARKPETLADLSNDNITPLRIDVLDPDSIQEALATIQAQDGRLDMLVNNAGVSLTAPLVEADFERLRMLVDTNLTSTIAMIQAVFPIMAEQHSGHIVNVGSVVGDLPTPYTAAYCATKAGLHMLTDVLRMELAPFGIHLTSLKPASVSTEIETRSAQGVDVFASADSRYQKHYATIRKRFEGHAAVATTAPDFADKVTPRLLLDPPPRNIVEGGNKSVLRVLARLPARLRDSLMRREFGL